MLFFTPYCEQVTSFLFILLNLIWKCIHGSGIPSDSSVYRGAGFSVAWGPRWLDRTWGQEGSNGDTVPLPSPAAISLNPAFILYLALLSLCQPLHGQLSPWLRARDTAQWGHGERARWTTSPRRQDAIRPSWACAPLQHPAPSLTWQNLPTPDKTAPGLTRTRLWVPWCRGCSCGIKLFN